MLKSTPSVFNINPDLENSFGTSITCLNDNRRYLDFFSSFASLPFGHNPEFLKNTTFKKDCFRILNNRTPLCAFESSIKNDYVKSLDELVNHDNKFANVIFAETGAMAVELAIKLFSVSRNNPIKIYTINNSFHGIYGMAGALTYQSKTAFERLNPIYKTLPSYKVAYASIDTPNDLDLIDDLDNSLIIVEPIQCTSGDLPLQANLIDKIISKQKEGLTVVSDEIQTGFLSTGHLWASDKWQLTPDILIFGKKFQVCGCLSNQSFSYLIEPDQPKYFSSTFDSSLVDLIRGKFFNNYLIKNMNYYTQHVSKISNLFYSKLHKIILPNNLRINGIFMAIDYGSKRERDLVVKKLFENNILCNPTGMTCIRFRANLNTTISEIEILLDNIIKFLP